jgi:hypothetical protein
MPSASASRERRGFQPAPLLFEADGTRNDHHGRDVRDVNLSGVVAVVIVAVVPGTPSGRPERAFSSLVALRAE